MSTVVFDLSGVIIAPGQEGLIRAQRHDEIVRNEGVCKVITDLIARGHTVLVVAYCQGWPDVEAAVRAVVANIFGDQVLECVCTYTKAGKAEFAARDRAAAIVDDDPEVHYHTRGIDCMQTIGYACVGGDPEVKYVHDPLELAAAIDHAIQHPKNGGWPQLRADTFEKFAQATR